MYGVVGGTKWVGVVIDVWAEKWGRSRGDDDRRAESKVMSRSSACRSRRTESERLRHPPFINLVVRGGEPH